MVRKRMIEGICLLGLFCSLGLAQEDLNELSSSISESAEMKSRRLINSGYIPAVITGHSYAGLHKVDEIEGSTRRSRRSHSSLNAGADLESPQSIQNILLMIENERRRRHLYPPNRPMIPYQSPIDNIYRRQEFDSRVYRSINGDSNLPTIGDFPKSNHNSYLYSDVDDDYIFSGSRRSFGQQGSDTSAPQSWDSTHFDSNSESAEIDPSKASFILVDDDVSDAHAEHSAGDSDEILSDLGLRSDSDRSGNPALLALPVLDQAQAKAIADAMASSNGGNAAASADAAANAANGGSASASANAVANSYGYVMPDPYGPLVPANHNCKYADQVVSYRTATECYVCVCVQRSNFILEPVCGSCNECHNNEPQPRPPYYSSTPMPWWTTAKPTENPFWSTTEPVWPYSTMYPPTPEHPTCDPLPTNVQFQNPLDPCQVCICRQTVDVFGTPSTPTIECVRNPECAQAPGPPGPPDPLPVCKHYPPNVWFPHPTLACEICRCSLEPTYVGPPKPVITCYPDPNCAPSTPPPPTQPPYPITTTMYPVTVPPNRPHPLPGPHPHESCYPYTPDEVFQHPWDACQACVCSESRGQGLVSIEVNCYTRPECCLEPITPALPDQPVYVEPQCRNRQPNQQFEYEGEICVCLVYNQYIVAQCTPNGGSGNLYPVHPSQSSVVASAIASAIASGGSSQAVADAVAKAVAAGGSSQATANAISKAVAAGGSSQSVARAIAEAISGTGSNASPNGPYKPYGLNQGSYGPGLNSGSSSASAEAIAEGTGYNQSPYGAYGPYRPGPKSGSSSASAEAVAEGTGYNQSPYGPYGAYRPSPKSGSSSASAEAIAESIGNIQSPYGPYGPNQGSYGPGQNSGSSSASAEAIANAIAEATGNNQSPYGRYKPSRSYGSNQGLYGSGLNSGSSSAEAIAKAIAEATSSGGGSNGNVSPYGPSGPSGPYGSNQGPYGPIQNPGLSSADAIAKAIAEATSSGGSYGNVSPYGPYGPYGPSPNSGSSSASAEAIAKAIALAAGKSGSGGGYLTHPESYGPGLGPYGTGSASAEASAQATGSSGGGSGNPNPGFSPYGPASGAQSQAHAIAQAHAQALAQAQSQAQAQAQAQANSQGGNSQAQALAQTQSNGGGSSQAQAQAYATAQKSGEPDGSDAALAA